MQNEFFTFLQLGFEHVTDPAGYDHMLFVIGLCALLRPEQWKRVLGLVTAFTVGHCITLLLAGQSTASFLPGSLVEQLVALSIFLAGAGNLYWLWRRKTRNFTLYFILTFIFGLVHGLAFSNFFRALGSEPDELWRQLLAFNVGVEVGQLLTVAWFFLLLLLLRSLFARWLETATETGNDRFQRAWSILVSFIVAAAGLYLMLERLPITG